MVVEGSCEAPQIDMQRYVVTAQGGDDLSTLEGKRFPNRTVLNVTDYNCPIFQSGNVTCRNGQWTYNVLQCPVGMLLRL